LALAVAKVADEAKVLLEYHTTGGRRRVTKRVGANVAPTLASQLETAGVWALAGRHDGGERSRGANAPHDLLRLA
jgi:hypothetical protein